MHVFSRVFLRGFFYTCVSRVFFWWNWRAIWRISTQKTRVMLQCPQPVLYQRAVVYGSTFSCTSTARSKFKNSHTCTVQYQDVKEQIIQFREIKGFSVLGRYHFAAVTKQDQSESLLSKITSSKLLNNIIMQHTVGVFLHHMAVTKRSKSLFWPWYTKMNITLRCILIKNPWQLN